MTSSQENNLYEAFLQLRTTKECKDFLRDLCTLKEIESMVERWQIVGKLQQNLSYRQIAKQTGSSTTTITRVAQWLHHGKGYRTILERMS